MTVATMKMNAAATKGTKTLVATKDTKITQLFLLVTFVTFVADSFVASVAGPSVFSVAG